MRGLVFVLVPLSLVRGDPPGGDRRADDASRARSQASTLERGDADDRGGPGGRARWRSSSSAPTAAVSSGRTRPIPFENPSPWSNLLEVDLDRHHPDGLDRDVRPDDQGSGACDGDLRRDAGACCWRASAWRSRPSSSRARPRPACRSREGGNLEGKEVRHRAGRLGDLGGDHDGHVQRLGQLDARQLPAAGRPGSDVAHDAQRRLQRHRRRLPEHADVRDRRRVPGRADGRADARVPGQEDRGQGGQAGDDRGPDPPAPDHLRDGPLRGDRLGPKTVANPGPHGFSEMLYEFTSASANNGSGFEGLSDNNPAWNIATGIVLLLGRFPALVLPIAIAGFLAEKKRAPHDVGHAADQRPHVRRDAAGHGAPGRCAVVHAGGRPRPGRRSSVGSAWLTVIERPSGRAAPNTVSVSTDSPREPDTEDRFAMSLAHSHSGPRSAADRRRRR